MKQWDEESSSLNGMVTNSKTIYDEMFENAELHDKNGDWRSIYGLAVLPESRKNGYAGKLINYIIEKATQQNRVGVTLTPAKIIWFLIIKNSDLKIWEFQTLFTAS